MARATRLTLWAERQFVRRSLRHRPDRGRLVELEPALAAKRDALAPIHHIVVLMMENHSYDNYLGMHEKGDGFTRGPDGLPTATNPDREGNPVPARRRPDSSQEHGLPTQSWRASYEQWNEGACDGFVVTAEDLARELGRTGDPKVAMSYWEEDDLPFYYCLARTFPVVDRWFGSCLGPTFPNRRFMIAGTAHGLIDDLPFGMLDYPKAGTIFDLLTANEIFWVNYHNVSPLLIALRRILGKPGLKAGRALGLLASQLIKPLMRWAFSRKEFTADLYPLGALGVGNHVRSLDRFFEDTANGTLPPFSIVDPDFRCFS